MIYKFLRIIFAILISVTSCRGPTDIYSSFDLERNELLNRMRIIERIYIWNNFEAVVKYPELISKNVFEGLPSEWKELKRLIRKSQFDKAYLIIKNESVDISQSLRYTVARFGFFEIARSFHQHFEDPEEAAWKINNLGREQWIMFEYPFFELLKYRYNESFQKSQIFELKPRNRNLNSLLCEIFTNLAVKIEKSGTQLILRNILIG